MSIHVHCILHLCVTLSMCSLHLPQAINTLSRLLEQHLVAIWEAFNFNEVEVEVLLDWLCDGHCGSIRNVYQEVSACSVSIKTLLLGSK